jgi:predicted  nucleic acid-binding Zn-ribbon protein
MNPQLQELLHKITTSINEKFKEHEERIEELENEVLSLQSALDNASACLKKASEK